MHIRPLSPRFGAAVHDLDVTCDIDDRTMRSIVNAFCEHRLLVFKNQSCNKDEYLQFGQRWGSPIPHVLDHMRMPGYPQMLAIGNTEVKDRSDSMRNGAALWHTDQSYAAEPATATMLYCLKTPKVGGETMFTDMVAAYEDLPSAERKRLDGMFVAHLYGAGKRDRAEHEVSPLINEQQTKRVPPIFHRLVIPHPLTGRKALYAIAHTAYAIKAMPEDEAEALLAQLKEHALQQKYIYEHRYEVGDIVLYDTMSTMHCAKAIDVATSPTTRRLLWRISVKGKPQGSRLPEKAAPLPN